MGNVINKDNFNAILTSIFQETYESVDLDIEIVEFVLASSSIGVISYKDREGVIKGLLLDFPYNLETLLFRLGINNFCEKDSKKITVNKPTIYFKEYIF